MAPVVDRHVDAPAELVWDWLARPANWHRWAPHVRGAWGLGAPEVAPGAVGAARVLGVLPVPARITGKEPDRSWTWRVGPVEVEHRVDPEDDGCRVRFDIRAPEPIGTATRVAYGPLMRLAAANLARQVAGRA